MDQAGRKTSVRDGKILKPELLDLFLSLPHLHPSSRTVHFSHRMHLLPTTTAVVLAMLPSSFSWIPSPPLPLCPSQPASMLPPQGKHIVSLPTKTLWWVPHALNRNQMPAIGPWSSCPPFQPCLLSLPTSLSALQPHRSCHCQMKPSPFLPQGLCTPCFCQLKYSSSAHS